MTIPDALYQQCCDKLTEAGYISLADFETARQVIPLVYAAGRAQGLEEAAKECKRHAAFCWDEAHKGGDYDRLITRHDEAKYNAERISALIPPPSEAKP